MAKLLPNLGINYGWTCPHSFAWNGMVECHHRRVVDVALTVMFKAGMPMQFWPYTFQSALFKLNLVSSKFFPFFSSCELLYNWTHDYQFLCVFGCLAFPCFMCIIKWRLCPLFVFSWDMLLNHRGYLCLDMKTNKIITSRNIVFT